MTVRITDALIMLIPHACDLELHNVWFLHFVNCHWKMASRALEACIFLWIAILPRNPRQCQLPCWLQESNLFDRKSLGRTYGSSFLINHENWVRVDFVSHFSSMSIKILKFVHKLYNAIKRLDDKILTKLKFRTDTGPCSRPFRNRGGWNVSLGWHCNDEHKRNIWACEAFAWFRTVSWFATTCKLVNWL